MDSRHQQGRELALFVNCFAHRFFAVAQFAQVAQAGFKFPQLDVVQPTRDLFAVAGNKRNGCAFVQQGDGGLHLLRPNLDFLRDLRDDFLHGE